MNEALLHKEVQDFISENYKADLSRLVFQGSPFEKISIQELAVQLSGKRKAEKKLPRWFATEGIIYPPTLNLEQTSSEVTAAYKASLIQGRSLADLTGGFGVDSLFFSERFEKVIHCELDPQLSEIVEHNSRLLKNGNNIQTFTGDSFDFLRSKTEKLDWIYVDPSRRDTAGGRVFRLSDCLPDIPEHLDLLFEKAANILVKTSPLLDLQAGLLSLQKVKEIHVVAVRNEVKELLWFLSARASGEVRIKTLNFKKRSVESYDGIFGREIQISYSPPLFYLYEPNAAIMKSGLFDALGEDLQLKKLHPNSQLFTSDELKDFPGRRFKILKRLPYSRKKLKRALDLNTAHITTRNFPGSVAALRKQLKLKDGGEHYLFFTTTGKDEKIVLLCRKIPQPSDSTGT